MKIFKKIYYPLIAVLITLTVVFGFLIANGVFSPNRLGSDFTDAVLGHAEIISQLDERNSVNVAQRLGARQHIFTEAGYDGVLNRLSVMEPAGLPDVENLNIRFELEENSSLAGQNRPMPSVGLMNVTSNSYSLSSATTVDDRVVFLRDALAPGNFENATQNVIVYLPGRNSHAGATDADVAIFSVRYDAIGPEATSAALVGIMAELILDLALDGTALTTAPTHYNDLIFIFADGGVEHDIGLRTALNQLEIIRPNGSTVLGREALRVGDHAVLNHVQFIAQFDTTGNRGPVMVTEAGAFGGATRSLINMGATRSSSVLELLEPSNASVELNPISQSIASVRVANVGGLANENTALDNFENLSRDLVRNFARVMDDMITTVGSADLSSVNYNPSQDTGVYFNYLGLFTISHPIFVGYILAGIILVLLLLIVVINLLRVLKDKKNPNSKRTSFSFLKVSIGSLVQMVAVVVGAIVVFLLYSLMALFLAGFGVIGIQAFIIFSITNPGIIISALVLFLVAMVAMYALLKKAFSVKAVDVVRGGVFVTAILAVVLAFALPQIAYLFTTLALLQLVVMLITMLAKDKFKAKFGFDIERLFLYVIPSIIVIPLYVSAITLISTLTPLVMVPVIVAIFAPVAFSILPYADYLKPLMQKLFGKLPKQHLRVEEEVTEMIEDKAKKGKFVEKTYVKKSKEKVPLVYRHAYGIAFVAILAFVSISLFSAFGGSFYSKIYSNRTDMQNYFWNGAINYVVEGGSRHFEVSDHSAMAGFGNFISVRGGIRNYVNLEWNADRGVYRAPITLPAGVNAPEPPVFESPRVRTDEDRGFMYRVFSPRSRVVVRVTNVAQIDEIRITGALTVGGVQAIVDEGTTEFVFANLDGADTITFILPFSYGNYINFLFSGTGAVGVSVEETVNYAARHLPQLPEIARLLASDSTVSESLNVNLIFRTSTSVN